MERTINIGGVGVRMRASALLPRLYRDNFNRDLFRDMKKLEVAYKKYTKVQNDENSTDEEKEEAQLSLIDCFEIFENLAWCMAWSADRSIPNTTAEWLDSIEGTFAIYESLDKIIDLWASGNVQTSSPVKK